MIWGRYVCQPIGMTGEMSPSHARVALYVLKEMTGEMSPRHARAAPYVLKEMTIEMPHVMPEQSRMSKGMTTETSLYHTGVTEFANIN